MHADSTAFRSVGTGAATPLKAQSIPQPPGPALPPIPPGPEIPPTGPGPDLPTPLPPDVPAPVPGGLPPGR
jgi:hypothetical protein